MNADRRRVVRIRWNGANGNEVTPPPLIDGRWPDGVPLYRAEIIYSDEPQESQPMPGDVTE